MGTQASIRHSKKGCSLLQLCLVGSGGITRDFGKAFYLSPLYGMVMICYEAINNAT